MYSSTLPENSRSPSIVTVEFASTTIFDVSLNDVATSAFVKVITPSPIVTMPYVTPVSALIVLLNATPVKSMSAPAAGAPFSQFAPSDIEMPSPSPVQKLPEVSPTVRISVSPETLQEYARLPSVATENLAPSAAVTPLFS